MDTEEILYLEEKLKNERSAVIYSSGEVGVTRQAIEVEEGAGFCGISFLESPYYFQSFVTAPAQSFLLLTKDHRGCTLYFALSHNGHQVSLQGCPGGLLLTAESASAKSAPILLVIRRDNVLKACRDAMGLALELTGGFGHPTYKKLPPPKWLDWLGWESGSSLGGNVSHEAILESIRSLAQKGVKVGYVLIGEGWQDCFEGLLNGFGADRKKFPLGLKGVVHDLHSLGVKRVGVSHGIMGGQNGISDSLAQQYDISCDSGGQYYLGTDLGRTFHFYHDYYRALREEGIAFTKVCCEKSEERYCAELNDPMAAVKNLQVAIQAASSVQMDSFPFNTGCLENGTLFYWANSRIASASSKGCRTPGQHIHHSLLSSLWLQYLMQPDFSPWTTNCLCPEQIAILNAVSGSLNMIGDTSGSRPEVQLSKMLLPSGKILKADRILTLCDSSIFVNPREERQIWKAFNRCGDSGILAIFHLYPGKQGLHGFVSSTDIEGLEGEFFAIYSHENGFIGTVRKGGAVPVTLRPGKGDVLTFSPIVHGIAVFGCHEFYLPPALLADVDIEEDSVHITMTVAGPLLLYCEKKVLEVRRNGHTVPWELEVRRKILSIDARAPIVEAHATYTILFES